MAWITKKGTREMNREQYISHLRTVACGLHLDGMQKWADLIVDNIHWAKEKTLTDEEIWEVINRTAWVGTEEEIRFKIAEAILRKAQEK
jgi:hypothetical protein